MLKRAEYYCSRLIVRQKEYKKIQRVHSIWLMQEYANRKEGVANHYSMKEECLGNRWKEKVENYGMMHIFMLYPKGKYDAKDTSFQNLMNVLFKNEHSVEEKLEILRKQFGIKVTETMEEEVEEMSHICMYYEQEGKKAGLAEGVLIGERRGKKSGLAKGIKQGKREGETKQINATISYVKNLMQKKNMTLKEAFDLLEIERDMQEKIRKELKKERVQ